MSTRNLPHHAADLVESGFADDSNAPDPTLSTLAGRSAGLISLRELSQRINIPLPSAYYLAQRGILPCIRIGCRWRVYWNVVKQRVDEGWKPSSKCPTVGSVERPVRRLPQAALSMEPPPLAIPSTRPKYATFEPAVLGTALSLTAIHLCTALQMVPVVLSELGTSILTVSQDISVIFLGLEQLTSENGMEVIDFATRGHTIVPVVLLPSHYTSEQLSHLPASLPVILCPPRSIEATRAVIARALQHLSSLR